MAAAHHRTCMKLVNKWLFSQFIDENIRLFIHDLLTYCDVLIEKYIRLATYVCTGYTLS